jgi:hypothetical protein
MELHLILDASVSELPQIAANIIDRLTDVIQDAKKLFHGGSCVFGQQHFRSPQLGHRELLQCAIDCIRVVTDRLACTGYFLLILLVAANELLDEFGA